MLYPKEDPDSRRLLFTCRTCQYTEEAQSSCVFRNILNSAAGETAGVTQDVGSDPTVSTLESLLCLMCGCPVLCARHLAEVASDDGILDISLLLAEIDDEPDDWEPECADTPTDDIEETLPVTA